MFIKILSDDYSPSSSIKKPGVLVRFFNQIPVSLFLIVVNFAIFIVGTMVEGHNSLWKFGSLHNALVSANGEYYRFFTALFLHANEVHLFLNLFSLIMVGPFVEHVFGKVNFIILYFFSGIASTLSSFFISLNVIEYDNHIKQAVGASGCIFGLVGALTTFFLFNKAKIDSGVRNRLLKNLIFVIGLNIFIGISFNYFISVGLQVDNAAHIGGLLGGMVAAYLMKPEIFGATSFSLAQWIALFFVIVVFAAFSWNAFIYLDQSQNYEYWIQFF